MKSPLPSLLSPAMVMRFAISLAVAAALLFHPAGVGAQTTAPAPDKAPPKPAVVPAVLTIDKDLKEVDLVGRQDNAIFYRPRGGPEGASLTLKVDAITDGEFTLEYDKQTVARAMFGERWAELASLLLPVVTPLLPYLDINENNGVSLAMDASLALLKAAKTLPGEDEANKARRIALYRRAYSMFKYIGKAAWSPDAELATLRAVECLTAVGDLRQAGEELEAARVPEAGDESYGLYWLVKAGIEYANKKTREAMNSAVKSVVFDNKNIETFPDALFLTARCYEDLLEWYRARDVYYEIARLFPGTGHAVTGREKLKNLLDKGLTKDKESSPIESVFFGLDEDVNERVRALLKSDDKPTEEVDRDEVAKEAETEGEAAIQKAEEKKRKEKIAKGEIPP